MFYLFLLYLLTTAWSGFGIKKVNSRNVKCKYENCYMGGISKCFNLKLSDTEIKQIKGWLFLNTLLRFV